MKIVGNHRKSDGNDVEPRRRRISLPVQIHPLGSKDPPAAQARWPTLLTLFALNPRNRKTFPHRTFRLYSFRKLYAAHDHPPSTANQPNPTQPNHPYTHPLSVLLCRSGRQATTTLSTFATPQLPQWARRQASDGERTKAIEREGRAFRNSCCPCQQQQRSRLIYIFLIYFSRTHSQYFLCVFHIRNADNHRPPPTPRHPSPQLPRPTVHNPNIRAQTKNPRPSPTPFQEAFPFPPLASIQPAFFFAPCRRKTTKATAIKPPCATTPLTLGKKKGKNKNNCRPTLSCLRSPTPTFEHPSHSQNRRHSAVCQLICRAAIRLISPSDLHPPPTQPALSSRLTRHLFVPHPPSEVPVYGHGQRGSLTSSVALSAFLCFCTHIPLLSQNVECGRGEGGPSGGDVAWWLEWESGVVGGGWEEGARRVLHTFRRFACTRTFRFWRRPTFKFRPCCAGAAT